MSESDSQAEDEVKTRSRKHSSDKVSLSLLKFELKLNSLLLFRSRMKKYRLEMLSLPYTVVMLKIRCHIIRGLNPTSYGILESRYLTGGPHRPPLRYQGRSYL